MNNPENNPLHDFANSSSSPNLLFELFNLVTKNTHTLALLGIGLEEVWKRKTDPKMPFGDLALRNVRYELIYPKPFKEHNLYIGVTKVDDKCICKAVFQDRKTQENELNGNGKNYKADLTDRQIKTEINKIRQMIRLTRRFIRKNEAKTLLLRVNYRHLAKKVFELVGLVVDMLFYCGLFSILEGIVLLSILKGIALFVALRAPLLLITTYLGDKSQSEKIPYGAQFGMAMGGLWLLLFSDILTLDGIQVGMVMAGLVCATGLLLPLEVLTLVGILSTGVLGLVIWLQEPIITCLNFNTPSAMSGAAYKIISEAIAKNPKEPVSSMDFDFISVENPADIQYKRVITEVGRSLNDNEKQWVNAIEADKKSAHKSPMIHAGLKLPMSEKECKIRDILRIMDRF